MSLRRLLISMTIMLTAGLLAVQPGFVIGSEVSAKKGGVEKKSAGKPQAAGGEHAAGGHDEEHGGHGHATLHGAQPKGLLGPGTEFLYVSPQLFFWTLLIFLPCVFVLRKVAWEPLLHSLENREHKVAESLRLAEEAKNDARKLLEEQDAYKANAFGAIRETIEQMKATAEKESERILAEAKAAAAADLESAKAEIEMARVEALGDLKSSSAALAAGMAGKLAVRSFDASRFAEFVEEVGS